MSNPLLNALFQTGGMSPIIQAFKNGGNPSAILRQAAQNNPSLQPIVQALNQGTNPQQLFYNLCQQRGIDPTTILNQLK